MKVFISADIEGTTGITLWDETENGHSRYAYFQEQMSKEVAAACQGAIEAGCDMLLLPYNFTNGYNGVMSAVKSNRITEERIDESVRRILALKMRYGLISKK